MGYRMFERRHEKLLPWRKFVLRVLLFASFSLAIIMGSLLIGMYGYHRLEGLSWVDSFLNAAMIMGGMGQISDLKTDAGKIFAGAYALYCGMALLIAVGLFAAPIAHRFLHHFHLESDKQNQ